ncbi:hypothetical protein JTB14_009163 [Gonioctena quinquepunctata]|nr:hypothetical protein JTB14_009163 [Gonioctena quinquepunctata]
MAMSFLKENKGCVFNCEEFVATDKGFVEVDFYEFPTDPRIREIWIERVRKQKKTKFWYPNTKSRLCGMHFNNSGKNILNEGLPRFFGDYTYPPEGNNELGLENVKIKEEIDVDEERIIEDNCIADYSNIYNTVPAKTDIANVHKFNPSNFEAIQIKEEPLDIESEDHLLPETDILEPQMEITDKVVSMNHTNGYISQKQHFNNSKVAETNKEAHHNSNHTKQWRYCAELPAKTKEITPMPTLKRIHTHTNDCGRDLKQLKEQMKDLEENLSTAYRKIADGQLLVMNLSSKEQKSIKLNEDLEEENRNLKNFFTSKMENSNLALKQEKEQLEIKLTKARQKIKLLQERWYRKFETLGSDEEARYYTGFQNRADFKKFCDIAIDMDPAMEPDTCNTFEIRKQIMITLMRLRQGLHIQDLAFRYNLDMEEVLQLVNHWQDILSESSFNRKICQSGVVIVKFLIAQFNNGVELKYFLGVSPYGYVIYVSDLHPLLTKDDRIIESSGVLSLIEEGFTIKSIDSDRLSHLGVTHWSVSSGETEKFENYITKLLSEVKKNVIFKNTSLTGPFWRQELSKVWKICCYLQNYIEF